MLGTALIATLGLALAAALVTRVPAAEHVADPALAPVEAPLVRPKPLRPDEQAGPVVPAEESVGEARAIADERRGLVSFAVIDTDGELHCHRCRQQQSAASVVKAMMLVAYLQRVARDGRDVTPRERRLLEAMISISDNGAADAIHGRLGSDALVGLAEQAGMESFAIRVLWSSASTSALDQVRFFARLDGLTPDRHRPYARRVLSSVVPEQAWGLRDATPEGWRLFSKGGWTPTMRGYLAHQAGRLEHDERWLTVAILTDGSPSRAYGRQTVRRIAVALVSE